MEFDHPALLYSGLLIGMVGFGLFIYGRKTPYFRCLTAGLVLGIVPMLTHSLLALWGLSALCVGGLYAARKWAQ